MEGSHNPDRDAQFEHINATVISAQAEGQPVISIDTKKKEFIGPYKSVGRDYRPQGCPEQVRVHDFVDAELGKVVPYGVYHIAANAGCVSVGINNDTAQFSVNSIRRWLDVMCRERYPDAVRLVITADGGGSNGSRLRLFKVELQKLADETGLTPHSSPHFSSHDSNVIERAASNVCLTPSTICWRPADCAESRRGLSQEAVTFRQVTGKKAAVMRESKMRGFMSIHPLIFPPMIPM